MTIFLWAFNHIMDYFSQVVPFKISRIKTKAHTFLNKILFHKKSHNTVQLKGQYVSQHSENQTRTHPLINLYTVAALIHKAKKQMT